jgi:hypothetical protein
MATERIRSVWKKICRDPGVISGVVQVVTALAALIVEGLKGKGVPKSAGR